MYTTVIIGGGIAGLNACYKLEKLGHKCIIFERNDYLGGRIKTHSKYGYEIGAARFSFKHKDLISLLKEFNLLDSKIAIPNTHVFKSYKYKNVTHEDIFSLIYKLLDKSKNLKKSFLRNNTLFDLCKQEYGLKNAQLLLDSFYYGDLLINTNIENAMPIFNNTMNLKEQYYILGGGLSKLINKLKSSIKAKILLEHLFVDYKYIDNIFHIEINNLGKHKTIKSKNLVLAIDKPGLLNIKNLKPISKELNSIEGQMLTRIYAIYPKNKDGKVWFDKMPKIYTDSVLQYIIPINYNSGLIMISYTDPIKGVEIKKSVLDGTIDKLIAKECKKLFPDKVIPRPTYLQPHIWENGVGLWNNGVDINKLYHKIIKPFKYPLFICGENYSKNQGWIEGALDTSNDIVRKMHKKRTQKAGYKFNIESNGLYKKILFDQPIKKIKINKSNKKPIKDNNYGYTKGKNLLWVDDGLKLDFDVTYQESKKYKKYTMKEISKHNTTNNAWIVIDNNVYDITTWIPFHPGGPIINEGIGKDATKMFNSMNHSSNARRKLHQFKIGTL